MSNHRRNDAADAFAYMAASMGLGGKFREGGFHRPRSQWGGVPSNEPFEIITDPSYHRGLNARPAKVLSCR